MRVSENPAADRMLNRKILANLRRAGDVLADAINATASIPGPPRSTPGTPPHIDRGPLHKSYDSVVDSSRVVAAVGSELPYAAALELGSPSQGLSPRPHILSTLMAQADDVAREIANP